MLGAGGTGALAALMQEQWWREQVSASYWLSRSSYIVPHVKGQGSKSFKCNDINGM